jgi:hypothetical protein
VKVGTVLRDSVAASVTLAAVAVAAGMVMGHLAIGFGLGAGLLIGSTNGHLVAATLQRRAPFALASIARLMVLSVAAIGVALLLGPQAWSVLIGVATAQALLVVAAVRQGVRA